MTTKIHIGNAIKEQVSLQKISVVDFAEKINCTPRNVYKIFKKPGIDTELLVKISSALAINFFAFYHAEEEQQVFLRKINNKQEALSATA